MRWVDVMIVTVGHLCVGEDAIRRLESLGIARQVSRRCKVSFKCFNVQSKSSIGSKMTKKMYFLEWDNFFTSVLIIGSN